MSDDLRGDTVFGAVVGDGLCARRHGQVLRVTEDDDVGAIGIDDEGSMSTAPLAVASGAVVVSVTGSSSR